MSTSSTSTPTRGSRTSASAPTSASRSSRRCTATPEILILDEPTGVLTPSEADHLFRILEGLRREGKTIILITHKLSEIMEATDTVSVMRRGEMTATVKTSETSPEQLAELMVGRKVLLRVDKRPATPGRVICEVQDLRVTDIKGVERLKGVSFDIRAGEILGVAGVAGNGQSELLDVLGGIMPATGGGAHQRRGDRPVRPPERRPDPARSTASPTCPRTASAAVSSWTSRRGRTSPSATTEDPEYGNGVMMDNDALRRDAEAKMQRFDVRPPNCWLEAKSFSGGNQQKIVLAREIERGPDLLLVGQPTRGVDIGAIEFIHQRIVALRDEGKAILLVSVELDEILSLPTASSSCSTAASWASATPPLTDERELGLLMAGMGDAEGAPAPIGDARPDAPEGLPA